MGDEAAGPPLQLFREGRSHDEGGRGSQDRRGRCEHIHLREELALGLDRLRPVLLHQRDALQGVGEVLGDADAGERARGIIDEAVAGELLQILADMDAGDLGGLRLHVVQRDLEAMAGEDGGPGPADQARADDGDLGHAILSMAVEGEGPLKATAPAAAAQGPG